MREGGEETEKRTMSALLAAVSAHNAQQSSDGIHLDLQVVHVRHDYNIIVGKTGFVVLFFCFLKNLYCLKQQNHIDHYKFTNQEMSVL